MTDLISKHRASVEAFPLDVLSYECKQIFIGHERSEEVMENLIEDAARDHVVKGLNPEWQGALFSIAISLKRIADAMEKGQPEFSSTVEGGVRRTYYPATRERDAMYSEMPESNPWIREGTAAARQYAEDRTKGSST